MIVGMSENEQKQREEFSAVVVGHVQGVGFRYFVIGKARMLGLRGYVRNDSAGDVEVIAQGPRVALEQLLVFLRQGPSAARVDNVQCMWREPTEHFSGFYIRY
jgi:acylphosphatase